jgi:pimeloyl-ACP methyl ester carboxylesterase
VDYKLKLKAYSKKRFDPFCRWDRISIPYKDGTSIETTIGQLNFFKWALENKAIDYIEQHFSTPIPIFGYSMGGYIALLIGHKRPDLVQQIATLATKFDWEPESTHKQLDKLNATIMAAKIPAYTAYLDSLHKSTPWQTVVENTYKVITDLGKNPPISNQLLSELQMPCRLGVGDHDVMVSVTETYERYRQIKQGSFYVLPNTIHPLEHVAPELLAHQIKHFITN